jgi:uncharacterized membrane protein
LISFLLKRPSSIEWDNYVKNSVIFAIVLLTIVNFGISYMFYDYIYTLFFSTMAINSIGIWLSYQFRKAVAGKIFAVLSLGYFLYNYADRFIDVINGLNSGMFFLPLLQLANTLLITYVLVRISILLFNDYGQEMDKTTFSTASSNASKYETLTKLKTLYDSGAISEEEYEAEKRKILE